MAGAAAVVSSAQRAAEPAVDEKEIAMKAASPWLAHAAALGGAAGESSTPP